jgi:hypothetical protein
MQAPVVQSVSLVVWVTSGASCACKLVSVKEQMVGF